MSEINDLSLAVNLRDLGGPAAVDGRRVRRGVIYRSAMLAGMTPNDFAALKALDLCVIVDLRANNERDAFPTPWEALGVSNYWIRDHVHDSGDLRRLLSESLTTPPEAIRSAMIDAYCGFPTTHQEAFRTIFHRLDERRAPILFHCSAGKDRTGVAAALILAALDVPMGEIVEDYLRTNTFDLRSSPVFSRDANSRSRLFDIPDHLLDPVLHADPEYLSAMFGALTARHGSVAAYLREVLGVDPAQRIRLRDYLLESAT